MAPVYNVPLGTLAPAQAAELSVLVDVEARWENLRKAGPPPGAGLQDLHARQKAYDAFHARMVAYNRQYTPPHASELLLNTPSRLALWCRRMHALFAQVEPAPEGRCPVHLVEKAYRWADHVGTHRGQPLVARPPAPPGTIREAIEALEAVARWCDGLTPIAAAPEPGPAVEWPPAE
jgi:hypothetical protein